MLRSHTAQIDHVTEPGTEIELFPCRFILWFVFGCPLTARGAPPGGDDHLGDEVLPFVSGHVVRGVVRAAGLHCRVREQCGE